MTEELNISTPGSVPDWLPTAARTAVFCEDRVAFSSDFPCGNGQYFRRLGPGCYCFRSRVAEQPFSYRFYLRIDGPDSGAKLRLRAVDFKMYDAPDVRRETAAVVSYDNHVWTPVSPERIRVLPDAWEADPGYDDCGGAYAVEYELRLDRFPAWFASPLPYLPRDLAGLLDAGRGRPGVEVRSAGKTACGLDIPVLHLGRPGRDADKAPTRVFATGGQHPSEVAGILAVEGMIRELLDDDGLRNSIELCAVPVMSMDGWLFGRTVVNCADAQGCNLNRDWRESTQAETRAVQAGVSAARPDIFVDCHNGRGWDQHRLQDYWPGGRSTRRFLSVLKAGVEADGRECLVREHKHETPGLSSLEAARGGLARVALIYENILTRDPSRESYVNAGRNLVRALVQAPAP